MTNRQEKTSAFSFLTLTCRRLVIKFLLYAVVFARFNRFFINSFYIISLRYLFSFGFRFYVPVRFNTPIRIHHHSHCAYSRSASASFIACISTSIATSSSSIDGTLGAMRILEFSLSLPYGNVAPALVNLTPT